MATTSKPLLVANLNQNQQCDEFIQSLSNENYLVECIHSDHQSWASRVMSLPEVALVLLVTKLEAADLNQIQKIQSSRPVPIVVLAQAHDLTVREIVAVGVHAYIAEPVRPGKLPLIVGLACERFNQWHALNSELKLSNQKLSERKIIEKAKGLLMQQKSISEQEAYDHLRRTAMNQGQTVAQLSSRIVSVVEILE